MLTIEFSFCPDWINNIYLNYFVLSKFFFLIYLIALQFFAVLVYVAQVVVVSLGGFCFVEPAAFALHSLHSPLSTATIKFYFMFMASVSWKLLLLLLLLLLF